MIPSAMISFALMAMRTFFLTAKGWLSGKSTFSMSNLGESLQLSLGFVGGPLQGYWQRGQESSFAATAKPAHALCLDGCIPLYE